jgi:hypothetical protein
MPNYCNCNRVLREYGEKLAKRSGLRIGRDTELLGCGQFGCVCALSDPRWVLKVTSDPTEASSAAQVKELNGRRSVLPRVKGVWVAPEPLLRWSATNDFLIIRENLADAPPEVQREWRACGDTKPCRHVIGEARRSCGKPTPPMAKFVKGVSELCKEVSGIDIGDLHTENIGIRPSTGEIVIRDLGMSSYGDTAPEIDTLKGVCPVRIPRL